MRRPIIAGNWKMNKTIAEAVDLVRSIRRGLNEVKAADRVLCPPFTALAAVREVVQATDIGLGAQNMYWQDQGRVHRRNLAAHAQRAVPVRHPRPLRAAGNTSERPTRASTSKVKAGAQAHGLTPIVCVGETAGSI